MGMDVAAGSMLFIQADFFTGRRIANVLKRYGSSEVARTSGPDEGNSFLAAAAQPAELEDLEGTMLENVAGPVSAVAPLVTEVERTAQRRVGRL